MYPYSLPCLVAIFRVSVETTPPVFYLSALRPVPRLWFGWQVWTSVYFSNFYLILFLSAPRELCPMHLNFSPILLWFDMFQGLTLLFYFSQVLFICFPASTIFFAVISSCLILFVLPGLCLKFLKNCHFTGLLENRWSKYVPLTLTGIINRSFSSVLNFF